MGEKVLFVCIHNSGRSQMAEAFLKVLGGDRFEVESAGLDPGRLNPIVVEAMREAGIDISTNRTKSIQDVLKGRKTFDLLITVCDETSAERCPTVPGSGQRIHWDFEDPASFKGSSEEKLKKTRAVRDKIKKTIQEWLKKEYE
ncbi:MAG: arsenate reductase ArsC [Candidatus Omnitrophica bacterium]|nr:arsenate reductase ArsC [Candidatus Omnitrophota bacterium]